VRNKAFFYIQRYLFLGVFSSMAIAMTAQQQQTESVDKKMQKASNKIKSGYKKGNNDTLAQGYYELGESFYKKGELAKSETYYQKAKTLYEKEADADGIAKSSRALGRVQEDLKKNDDAISNYRIAYDNSRKIGDTNLSALNGNDFSRLSKPASFQVQADLIQQNLNRGLINKDTNEVVSNMFRMANLQPEFKSRLAAGYVYSPANTINGYFNSTQAVQYNQLLTNAFLSDSNFPKAIEIKKSILSQEFVKNSTELKAKEINSLADIYLLKKEDTTAVRLLNESYALSVKNGHTLEARASVDKLDSIFRSRGRKEMSLKLYKNFLDELPAIIARDSSIADNRLIAETETRIKELETEKIEKDNLIRRKNISNNWLMLSVAVLILFAIAILFIQRKLRIRNKKIALQSLRREMNPHFIFNSLNSINQFIANNNELEANRYLTKFSTLMRRVMENSKDDFVSLTKEIELLQNYLELEKSRFPDKFDFNIKTDEALLADEQNAIPGMLIQPHLENAVWHGLRYNDKKGFLQLSFAKTRNGVEIIIEDNGIGIAESKKNKTINQQKHSGRGIANTMERINILNELYKQHITCEVEDKLGPGQGVKVTMQVPLLKNSNT